MLLSIYFHCFHVMMCCQFQWERMLLLASSILPLKALTLEMTLICLSASMTYHFLCRRKHPFDIKLIHNQQNTGTKLVINAIKYPDWYVNKLIDGQINMCHVLPNDDCLTKWKIALEKEMIIPLVKWYHTMLLHHDSKRSWMTIQAWYYHPDSRKQIDNFHCDNCQCVKIPCNDMGLLPDCDLTNNNGMKLPLTYRTVVCKERTL